MALTAVSAVACGGGEGIDVPRGNKEPRLAVEDGLGDAADAARHDRLAERERLEQRERQPLPERREHVDVERREQVGHVATGAREREAVPETGLPHLTLELAARPRFNVLVPGPMSTVVAPELGWR